jgi:hypothetical protein
MTQFPSFAMPTSAAAVPARQGVAIAGLERESLCMNVVAPPGAGAS